VPRPATLEQLPPPFLQDGYLSLELGDLLIQLQELGFLPDMERIRSNRPLSL